MENEKITFLQTLANIAGPMAAEQGSLKHIIAGTESTSKLAKHQEYLSDCFLALGEIEALLSQLNYAAISLASFRNSPILKKNKISRYDHMVYHLEGYLLRATGVIDRLLILVNCILEINLPSDQCIARNLLVNRRNEKGKHSQKIEQIPNLFNQLIALLKYIDCFRDDRNSIAHNKKISYQDLATVEMYHILILDPRDFDVNRIKYFVKKQTDEKAVEYKKELLICNEKIKTLLNPIYQILEPEFFKRYNELFPI